MTKMGANIRLHTCLVLLLSRHFSQTLPSTRQMFYATPARKPSPFRGWDEWRISVKKFQRRCIHNYAGIKALHNYGSLYLQIQTVSE
jgi:hypothetical protein